jgi:large subunit ribosomal protein L5
MTKEIKKVKEKKSLDENPMRKIRVEKVVLGVGGTGDYLEKGYKLLKYLTNGNPMKKKATKRIPTWGVRPGLEVATVITLRENPEQVLKRMLTTIDNVLKKKQVSENTLSFGIKEYIEVPGVEYQRDIGIMGFDVTVTFKRSGRRVKLRKIKQSKVGKKQIITKEEIIKFMEENFGTKFK